VGFFIFTFDKGFGGVERGGDMLASVLDVVLSFEVDVGTSEKVLEAKFSIPKH